MSWLWLFPLTYLLHLIEEFWGGEGFPHWIARIAGARLTAGAFWSLNSLGWVAMTVGIFLARRGARWRWIVTALSGVVLLNAFLHVLSTLLTRAYSPGLLTALLLWLPLGAFGLAYERRTAPPPAFRIGSWVAFGLTFVVLILIVFPPVFRY